MVQQTSFGNKPNESMPVAVKDVDKVIEQENLHSLSTSMKKENSQRFNYPLAS